MWQQALNTRWMLVQATSCKSTHRSFLSLGFFAYGNFIIVCLFHSIHIQFCIIHLPEGIASSFPDRSFYCFALEHIQLLSGKIFTSLNWDGCDAIMCFLSFAVCLVVAIFAAGPSFVWCHLLNVRHKRVHNLTPVPHNVMRSYLALTHTPNSNRIEEHLNKLLNVAWTSDIMTSTSEW